MEQCWSHHCPITFALQLYWHPFILKDLIDMLPFCQVRLNSVVDIHINLPIPLNHRPQVFEFLNLFDWMAAEMDLTRRSSSSYWKVIHNFVSLNCQSQCLPNIYAHGGGVGVLPLMDEQFGHCSFGKYITHNSQIFLVHTSLCACTRYLLDHRFPKWFLPTPGGPCD